MYISTLCAWVCGGNDNNNSIIAITFGVFPSADAFGSGGWSAVFARLVND